MSSTLMMPGYLGIFITILISPVPDYFVVPLCGLLSSLGFFNPYFVFLACLVGAVIPIEFVCGRLAARPVLLKVMSFLHVSEEKLEATDKWIIDHGNFSIFIATFIPFFYSAVSLAAGTLKMGTGEFLWSSAAGFALRFIFLEAIGYFSISIFTASFDYSQRTLFFVLLVLSSVYIVVHIVRFLAQRNSRHTD
ncbi:MAG TPA: DedA family protein [Candidatus Limnocylindrales bacterium]|nr:DedA family protein [Candidatus Limnocylindrales bacterium]